MASYSMLGEHELPLRASERNQYIGGLLITVQIISDHGVLMPPMIIEVFSQLFTGRGFLDPPKPGIETVECPKYRILKQKDRLTPLRDVKIILSRVPASQ